MGTVMLRFLLGGIAGIVAWMVWEPLYPKTLTGDPSGVERNMVLTAGLLIGGVIAGLSGFTQGGKIHTLRGLGLGAVFGMIGIMFGYGMGGGIVTGMFPPGVFVMDSFALPIKIAARLAVTIPTAAFLGLAVGAATLNVKRTVQGFIGGLLAGVATGLVFDPVGGILAKATLTLQGQATGETGSIPRAILFLCTGASIGLFIGLVERFARSAWIRLQLGRNEGREWSLDSAQTFIGRSESAHIPLFGDANVAPVHCSIQRHGKDWVLVDGGSPIGTGVNGQRVQSMLLTPGSTIQVGSFVLQFMVKNQPAPRFAPEAYNRGGMPIGGAPAGGYSPGPMMPQGAPTQMMGMPQPPAPQPMPQQMPMPGAPTQMMPGMGGGSTPTVAYGGGMAGFGTMTLVAIDGPMLGQRIPVSGPVEIGREGSGIRLSHDANASRRHAVFQPGMGAVTVQDLNSTNGTYVNGQRVSQATAGPGDTIKVGSTTFRVEAG